MTKVKKVNIAVTYGLPYFVKAVSYTCKMFMKLTTGVNVIKLFYFVTDKEVSWRVCLMLAFSA